MLRVDGVSFRYGGVWALREVSLEVGASEVVCLLGANGAGKTTLLSVISGLLAPRQGQVFWRDQPVGGRKPSGLVAAGVVQVPEGRQLFAHLSVAENLELGAYLRLKTGQAQEVRRDLERIYGLFPRLAERATQPAGTLSGGEQQMAAMGRALMASPRLLLLDEPSLGLAPKVAAEIFRVVRGLPAQGCSVLLVEQNALGALAISQRGYILTQGSIRFAGSPQQILRDQLLREAFLGPERAAARECPPPPQ